jgi:hypothetical protein
VLAQRRHLVVVVDVDVVQRQDVELWYHGLRMHLQRRL